MSEIQGIQIMHPDADHEEKPVSYSSFTSWLRCGKAYQLEKIVGVVPHPAWYFAGGSAFHSASEEFDRLLFEQEGR